MKLEGIHSVYFLGIGGIGMSALARYFKAAGLQVAGYDKTPTPLTDELIAEGIDIHFEDNVNLIAENFKSGTSNQKSEILIVYTPAVPSSHSEYVFFSLNGFNIKKRAEVLGLITQNLYTLAVAGTHGKTTTSSLIAHILKVAGVDCSAFLGGITKNYGTNLLLSKTTTGVSKKTHPIVVEADEYDRSFLTLHPDVAVITSLDADHLDIYGDKRFMEESYSLFGKQVKKGGTLIVKKSIEKTLNADPSPITYSADTVADYYAKNIKIENGQYIYDVVCPSGTMEKLTLGLPGKHNVENSVAAIAMAKQVGVSDEDIRKALASFSGVKRRFDYQVKTDKLVFIDDYAHHPEELKACISSVKQMYPTRKLTGIFQPHLYTRTRDFADAFAQSLDLLDEAILLEIYPARELPIEGVNSAMLLSKMRSKNKMICEKKDIVEAVTNKMPELLLTLGAGDIDTLVEPLKKALLKKYQLQ